MKCVCSCVTTRRSYDASACVLLALTVTLIAALEIRRPLFIDPWSAIPFLTACTPLAAVSFFYGRVRRREKLAVVATALLQILTFSALGCVLQYLLAREGGDLWNATLLRWDRNLGMD